MSHSYQVVAVIATYLRHVEMERLLEHLRRQTIPLAAVVVADNASDAKTEELLEKACTPDTGLVSLYIPLPGNPGCGAGLKTAEDEALRQVPGLTHFWILDDDVVPPPDCLEKLLRGLESANADLICPLLADEKGNLWGFPEPKGEDGVESFRKIIRQCVTPQDALVRLGSGPHRMWWCTGACVLVSADAVRKRGGHRGDYWMLGEDHEFSMRMGQNNGSVFICDVTVPHLPPPSGNPVAVNRAHYLKFLALLQNISYNGLRLSYSGPMWRYIPGNFKRFFKTFGISNLTFSHALRAFVYGAFFGEAAGGRKGSSLRSRVGTQAPSARL